MRPAPRSKRRTMPGGPSASAAALVLPSAVACRAVAQGTQPLAVVHANVVTLDPLLPWAEAVALCGGLVAATGTTRKVCAAVPVAEEAERAGAP